MLSRIAGDFLRDVKRIDGMLFMGNFQISTRVESDRCCIASRPITTTIFPLDLAPLPRASSHYIARRSTMNITMVSLETALTTDNVVTSGNTNQVNITQIMTAEEEDAELDRLLGPGVSQLEDALPNSLYSPPECHPNTRTTVLTEDNNDPLAQGQLSEVVPPDTVARNVMIEFLASHGMINNLNDVFKRMLTDGTKGGIPPSRRGLSHSQPT
ncbi:hypothetical protein JOM56_008094 [Amanita muscaria]